MDVSGEVAKRQASKNRSGLIRDSRIAFPVTPRLIPSRRPRPRALRYQSQWDAQCEQELHAEAHPDICRITSVAVCDSSYR